MAALDPILEVVMISNGFLLKFDTGEGTLDEYHYCKDAKEIAELIIASAAREKLGIPTQLEMFTPSQMGHKLKETNDE